MLGSTFIKKDASGQIPGSDKFLHVEFTMVAFAGGIILCTAEDPIGPAAGWGLKPRQGPDQVSL